MVEDDEIQQSCQLQLIAMLLPFIIQLKLHLPFIAFSPYHRSMGFWENHESSSGRVASRFLRTTLK